MITRQPAITERHGFWRDNRMFVRVPPEEARAFQLQFPASRVVIKAYGEFTVFEVLSAGEQTAALVSLEFLPAKP